MVKTEWGEKRECAGCGARFYDLGRVPIVCPKCDEVFTPEATKLTRAEARAKAKAEAEEKSKAEDAKATAAAAVSAEVDDDEAALLEAAGIGSEADDDDDDDEEEDAGLIEGGFDIEGGDDVADVVDAPISTKTDDV